MSPKARIGLLAATVLVIVLAFVVLKPGDDDGSDTPTTTPIATGTTPAPEPASTTTTVTEDAQAEASPPPPPAPSFEKIAVRGGKPVGGVQTITVKSGKRARIEVSSTDTSDEIHLHGYDLSRDLKAGGKVRFSFDADADGIFEIELEGAGVEIGKLVVEP